MPRSATRLGLLVFGFLASTSAARAATITIVATDLDGVPRANQNATIIQAVNKANQPVDARAKKTILANGVITIEINDPEVRAITVVVTAGRALTSNHQTLRVTDQRLEVALPNDDQAEYYPASTCCESPARRGICGLFRRR